MEGSLQARICGIYTNPGMVIQATAITSIPVHSESRHRLSVCLGTTFLFWNVMWLLVSGPAGDTVYAASIEVLDLRVSRHYQNQIRGSRAHAIV